MVETLDDYGVLIEPATLKIRRLLPGPIERVWAYLTESSCAASGLRRARWRRTPALRSGRSCNHELTDPPGARPPGFGQEHRMQKPHHRVRAAAQTRAFTWGTGSDVSSWSPAAGVAHGDP